ncbi:family 78 glycoside hydrolase catalytic domain [Conexibacter arvalis]|uniref:alpha-L-rhamnosidase n=1 Tax=Conexibacter arvalis TaxID=912552 RepID=A0A840IC59_9ACTN|nr:family 78 glycoside hydrolase catalytic domain [Conexibacter arvalis]MBB4661905.1 alpha-L-rhamnosidase [Conexibacter arvalis]
MARSLRGAAVTAALMGAAALAAPAAATAHGQGDGGRSHHGPPGHDRDHVRGGAHGAGGDHGRGGPGIRPERLEAEHAREPLGLGSARPRLGWQLDAGGRRGAAQSGFRIVVERVDARGGRAAAAGTRAPEASGAAQRLGADARGGHRVVWDSGIVRSRAQEVRYGGPALDSRTRYRWRVQALDERGRRGPWSRAATFETGLLSAADWRGSWIGAPGADEDPAAVDLAGTNWIWEDAGDPLSEAPAGSRWFRRELTLPAGARVASAKLVVDADDGFTAWVNGSEVSATDPDPAKESWRNPQLADVTALLRAGANAIAVRATNGRPSPAGMFARLVVETVDGQRTTVDSDSAWKVAATAPADGDAWTRPGYDDTAWRSARELVAWGGAPWGEVRPQVRARPEPLLRRSFTLGGGRGRGANAAAGKRSAASATRGADPVGRGRLPVRARLYASGVAYADFTLNGRRVTDAVLDPAFARYDRRVFAVTHDVTKLLRRGENVLGARLGRGFFGMRQGNAWNWDRAPWTSEPRVRAQLELTWPDGRVETIATDGAWKTHDGPTRTDSLYAGEHYDAREQRPGWDEPGFDDRAWASAAEVRAPAGRVEPQAIEPIVVSGTLSPTDVTNPRAGTYVFELPRVMAGWARIHVRGEAGRTVTLRYGEKLKADGTVQHESGFVTGESQVDRYTLNGDRRGESWEPRYSYKGFRYVQLDGWPGSEPPTVDNLDGRVVHTDLTSVGDFDSDDPLLNRMREITRTTVVNNYHGIPTDTPMYEKNGWTGDAMLMAETLQLEYDMRRLLPKWVDDIADSQGPQGNLPGLAPDNGWGLGPYGQAPPWNAAFLHVPWILYERYGDRDVLVEHYDAMKRYVEHELTRARPDGTHPSFLNDYLAPRYGSGNSPEDPALAGTAYAFRNVAQFARIAKVLGRDDDAARYEAAAARIREAFNGAFLNGARDAYVTASDPGYRQTSNLLALAFGLVPADAEQAVERRLLDEIAAKGDHLDTGALGTRELLSELTRRGHGELAYKLVAQPTYPSFRFIVDQGATAWWEGWEPTVRSYDHTFVQGTVNQWLIERVAGIRPLAPGYERVLLQPGPVGEVDRARAATATPRGEVALDWKRSRGGRFELRAEVPVGATAVVDVPAARAADVRESGRPAARADGVRQIAGAPSGSVRFEVVSGSYRFTTGR